MTKAPLSSWNPVRFGPGHHMLVPVWAGCSQEEPSAGQLQVSCSADNSFRNAVRGMRDWKRLRFCLLYILKCGESLLFSFFFLYVFFCFVSTFLHFTASEMLWQILDNIEFCGHLYNVQCQLRNAVIIAVTFSFLEMGISSLVGHLCFLLLSLLFAINRHKHALHSFVHHHTRYLLSKDEEY